MPQQVQPSSEESEESQKEEEESNLETNLISCDDETSKISKKKTLHKSQREETQAKELNNLTSSQLQAIIGGSLIE